MDTQVACLTAPGKAGIATLAVRGPLAWSITRELFKPAKGELPTDAPPGRFCYGKFGTDQADDAILAVKVDAIELHCHGGIEVVRMVQELYRERGAVVVPWQQFLGEPAEIIAMLAHAPTTRTADILLDQATGAWDRCVAALESAEPRQQRLTRLEELVPLGRHLVDPWRIVIAGAPNVGKSSLMNALAGYTRSIIAPTPGTTRDLVSVRLAIDGWPVEVTDTAGIRSAPGDLEQQGVARALDAARGADLRFWVLDGSSEPIFPDEKCGWSLLINKIDLPAQWDWQSAPDAMRVSARTQAGIADWCARMSHLLVPSALASGEAVPCTQTQFAWLAERVTATR